MTSKKCDLCGFVMSSAATECRKCAGGKTSWKKPALILGIVFAIAAVVLVGSILAVVGFAVAGRSAAISLKHNGPFNHNADITTEFDRFTNVTTVKLSPMPTSDGIEMSAFFVPGDSGVVLHVISQSETWRFLQHHPIVILADNKQVVSETLRHDGHVIIGGGGVLEQMFVTLPYSTFVQMVNADKLEMRLSSNELKITDDHLQALRDLATRYANPHP